MEEHDRNRRSLRHSPNVSNPAISLDSSFHLDDLPLLATDLQFLGLVNSSESVVSLTPNLNPELLDGDYLYRSRLQELLNLTPASQQQSIVSPPESFLQSPSRTLPSLQGNFGAEQLHAFPSDLPGLPTDETLLQCLLAQPEVGTESTTFHDPHPSPSTASLSAVLAPSTQFQVQGDPPTYPRHLALLPAVRQVATSGSTLPPNDTPMFFPRRISPQIAPSGIWTPQSAPSGTLPTINPSNTNNPNTTNSINSTNNTSDTKDTNDTNNNNNTNTTNKAGAQHVSADSPAAGTHWAQQGRTPGKGLVPNITFLAPQSTPSNPLAGSSRSRAPSSLIPSLAAAVGTQFTPGVLRMPTESQGVVYDHFVGLGQALWDEGVRWEGLVFSNCHNRSASQQEEQDRSSEGCRGRGFEAEGHEGVTESSERAQKSIGKEVLQSDRLLQLGGIFGRGQGGAELTSKLAGALKALQQRNVRGSINPVPGKPLTALAIVMGQGTQRSDSLTAVTPGTSKSVQVGEKRRERAGSPGACQVEKGLNRPNETQLNRRVTFRGAAQGHEWSMSDVRNLLQMLAEALHAGNMAAYTDLRAGLAPLDDPKGSATERIVHLMLMSLELRREGSGHRRINEPAGYRTHMLKSALMWYATAYPGVLFSASANMSYVIPHILGKSKVHLVCFGYSIVSQLNVYMKLLSAPGQVNQAWPRQSGESGNSGEGCLQRLRVTFIDLLYLHRPGRSDYKELFEWGTVGPFLAHEANALNIDFQFQVLTLQEDNVHCLDLIQKEPREALAVCDAVQFQDLCDDTQFAGGVLQHVMRTLQRLQPVVVALAEGIGELSGSNFLQRYVNSMDFAWHLFSSHDACSAQKGKRWQIMMETFYHFPQAWSAVACEGVERGFRMRSASSWRRIFTFWGFELIRMDPTATESLSGFVGSFPRGFDVTHEEGVTHLTWKDCPLLAAFAFRPVRK